MRCRENVSDTNPLGILHHGELAPLSAYLRAHQGSAYYEAAFDSGTKMGELVERDARPILVLTTLEGHVFTSVARLRALVAAGKVRYAFLDEGCGPQSPPTDPDCSAPARWVSEHGTDVSRQAGMPRPGTMLPRRLPRAAESAMTGTLRGNERHRDTTSLKILVVDDEETLRETLTHSFSREGHTVEAVASGDEAIARAGAEHFDVVLLDVALGAGAERLRGVPHAARAAQRGADHHAHRARHRGRRRAGAGGRRRRLCDQAVRPRRAAQPRARRAAPLRAARARPRGDRRRPGGARPRPPRGDRGGRAGAPDLLRVRAARAADVRAGPPAQPPGAAARDLGRLGLPRPARDRRPHPPPAREARGAPRGAEADPDRARGRLPLPGA